jgi:hypothetical protein
MKFNRLTNIQFNLWGSVIAWKVKWKTHDLNHDLTFSVCTINCVCHSIRSMFRVFGIYNFVVGSEVGLYRTSRPVRNSGKFSKSEWSGNWMFSFPDASLLTVKKYLWFFQKKNKRHSGYYPECDSVIFWKN